MWQGFEFCLSLGVFKQAFDRQGVSLELVTSGSDLHTIGCEGVHFMRLQFYNVFICT